MKRPIVYFGLAFVFGEILGFVWQWLRGLLILISIILSVCSGRKKTHILEKMCFFILPVFILLGCMRMTETLQKEQQIIAAAKQMPQVFEGTVLEINKKQKVVEIILESNAFQKGMKIRCLVPKEGIAQANVFGLYGTIVVEGKAEVIEHGTNPGCYDAYNVFRLENIYYQINDCRIEGVIREGPGWLRMLERLKDRMQSVISQSLDSELSGILKGMVTGDKSDIPDEISSLYQSQGIAHILAISGLHVSMAGMGLREILKKIYIPFYTRQTAAIIAVFLYICMCGFSASSMRAFIMFVSGVVGEMIGRTKDEPSVLSAAAIIILLREPLVLFSFGFLMSFGCILSLMLMQSIGGKNAGVYITILTMPMMAWFQYEISLYSVLINMIVVPVMGVLFPMGLVGSLAGCMWLMPGKFLCQGAGMLLKLYGFLCEITEKMPLSTVITGRPQMWEMVLIYSMLGIVCLISWQKKDEKKQYFLLLVMLLLFVRDTPDQMEMLFLDVGQGDCCIIRTKEGETVMIDGGSTSKNEVGKYIISKVLKYYGISHIDYMILSHMDEDHVNGAMWLLEDGWHVGQIVLPGVICNQEMKEQFLDIADKRNIPVSRIYAGDELRLGKNDADALRLTCLHPQKDFVTDSDNAASAVIAVRYGQTRFLLTGDVEGNGEQQMLEYMKWMGDQLKNQYKVDISQKIDVLKVAHHGSKNSTSEEFLDYVNLDYAIISCGKNNIYGHPHEALMARLSEAACTTAVTAQTGAVLVQSDGNVVSVQKYQKSLACIKYMRYDIIN